MPKQAKITLSTRYEAHGRIFDTVVLHEPTYALLMELGAPQQWIYMTAGVALVENQDAIKGYVERLLRDEAGQPIGIGLIAQFGVADTEAVKAALFGFFPQAGAAATKTSTTTPTPSSSTTASASPTS